MNKKILSQITDASMYRYPYQNLSLVDMEGEVWKPLPDYEKYIMISILGSGAKVKLQNGEVDIN